MRTDVPPALRALLDVGGALLRQSANGRLLLGRTAGIVAPEVFPEALAPLEAALDRARVKGSEPLAPKQVEKALRGAWGRPPGKVLDALDLDEPAAVTPLAQVHRGVLAGAPVAVKVRRPGLDNAVRADLALLDALRPPLAGAFSALDGAVLLRRIREQALDELDLEHEAAQQRAVGRALRDVAGLVVPATHTELAGSAVLVSAWLDGPTLAGHDPADPSEVARVLLAAHVTAARAGLVLIDPRPNHVVLLDDGRVGLLGTGNAVAADRARLALLLTLPAALRDDDPARFAGIAVDDLRLLPDAATAGDAHALLRDLLGDLLTGPARADAAALEAVGTRGLRRLPEVFALLSRGAPDPGDVWLARGMAQLAAVLGLIGAEEDWVALLA